MNVLLIYFSCDADPVLSIAVPDSFYCSQFVHIFTKNSWYHRWYHLNTMGWSIVSTEAKRIERMRNNPKGWSIEDVDWLLINRLGCEWRQNGTSHRIYTHPTITPVDFPDGVNVPFNRPIKPKYIERVLEYYDAIKQGEE